MKIRKGTFEVRSKMYYEQKPGDQVMNFVKHDVSFEIGGQINPEMYIDGKKMARKLSSRMITDALVMALIGNIEAANTKGWENTKDHLEFIKMRLDVVLNPPPEELIEK